VPIVPNSFRTKVLYQCHDAVSAGHIGPQKTAEKGYWVGLLQDVNQYCSKCVTCQSAKPPAPQKAPLNSVSIGKPWELVAMDILQVPLSCPNNLYILVVQDYFTKWAEAIPLPNQIAANITRELVNSKFGMLDILHSDQGRNFESFLLRQTLDAFGVVKSRTTAYHPQGDGMVKGSTVHYYKCYVHVCTQAYWEEFLPLVWFTYCTSVHTSTGVSPFELMFGRNAQNFSLTSPFAFDPQSYSVPSYHSITTLCKLIWLKLLTTSKLHITDIPKIDALRWVTLCG